MSLTRLQQGAQVQVADDVDEGHAVAGFVDHDHQADQIVVHVYLVLTVMVSSSSLT